MNVDDPRGDIVAPRGPTDSSHETLSQDLLVLLQVDYRVNWSWR